MNQVISTPMTGSQSKVSPWNRLYQISGIATLIMFVLIPHPDCHFHRLAATPDRAGIFSYILGSLALIILSAVILQSNLFSKSIACIGLAANIIAFGLLVPTVGVFISIFSVILLWIWDLLIALRLLA